VFTGCSLIVAYRIGNGQISKFSIKFYCIVVKLLLYKGGDSLSLEFATEIAYTRSSEWCAISPTLSD